MTTPRWTLATVTLLLLAACPGSGDDTAESASTSTSTSTSTSAAESGETGCVVSNGCGTFDLCEPGDSVVPDDPDTPEIVMACTGYCTAIDGIGGCVVELDACVAQCKADACGICPGTLAPLVECRTQELDAAACTCDAAAVECPLPMACADLQAATNQCGG